MPSCTACLQSGLFYVLLAGPVVLSAIGFALYRDTPWLLCACAALGAAAQLTVHGRVVFRLSGTRFPSVISLCVTAPLLFVATVFAVAFTAAATMAALLAVLCFYSVVLLDAFLSAPTVPCRTVAGVCVAEALAPVLFWRAFVEQTEFLHVFAAAWLALVVHANCVHIPDSCPCVSSIASEGAMAVAAVFMWLAFALAPSSSWLAVVAAAWSGGLAGVLVGDAAVKAGKICGAIEEEPEPGSNGDEGQRLNTSNVI